MVIYINSKRRGYISPIFKVYTFKYMVGVVTYNNYLWTGIAFGDDKFVMVNRDYGYDGVTYSHDGAEWITTVDRFYQDNVDVTDRVLAMFKS